MTRSVLTSIRVIVIFVICTSIFYYGLKIMHEEYNELHKYDEPKGPAAKVFQTDKSFLERLNLFFQLGE